MVNHDVAIKILNKNKRKFKIFTRKNKWELVKKMAVKLSQRLKHPHGGNAAPRNINDSALEYHSHLATEAVIFGALHKDPQTSDELDVLKLSSFQLNSSNCFCCFM